MLSHCGGRTRKVRTAKTRLGYRQTRECPRCGTRIYIQATLVRVEPPPAGGFASGSSSPIQS